MGRVVVAGTMAVFLWGCAAAPPRTEPPRWEARVQELERARSRLELRLDEMNRNLLALRERLDAQEQALEKLAQGPPAKAPARAPEPKVRVVELVPPEAPRETQAPQPPLPDAADLYRRAYSAYQDGRYGQAILDFEEFLQRYPDHEYADNAQYWIGESFYSQGEYEQAVVEFQRVVDRYPNEPKAPDALYKIGRCYEQMGDLDKARVFWARVVKLHPDSEAAREARKRLEARGGEGG